MIARTLSGARAETVEWSETECSAPCLKVRATIQVPGLVRGEGARRMLRVDGLGLFPDQRFVEDRTFPMALRAGTRSTRWKLRLPPGWCAPQPFEERVENDVGFVLSRVEHDEGTATITREAALHRSWIGPEHFEQLLELAVSETRTSRRNIRLRCPPEE